MLSEEAGVSASNDAALPVSHPDFDGAVDAGGGSISDANASFDAGATHVDAASASAGDANRGSDANKLDAGDNLPGPHSDASVMAAVDALPSWAKPLLGRYAKRSIIYAYDDPIQTVTVEATLIDIAANAAGEIKLSSKLCKYAVHWSTGAASLVLDKPEALPPVELRIALGEAPHFSSDTAMQAMGFEPSRQSRCTSSGAHVMKFDDQKWLTSTCTCASAPEVLPTDPSDCRVADQDGDGRAGVLFLGSGIAIDATLTINTSLKISAGEVRVDREHVLTEQRTRNEWCFSGCSNTDILCPNRDTLVRPLDMPNPSCADALAAVDPIPVPILAERDCRAK
jgi:hypothetical protein